MLHDLDRERCFLKHEVLTEVDEVELHIIGARVTDLVKRIENVRPIDAACHGGLVLIGQCVVIVEVKRCDAGAQLTDHVCGLGISKSHRLVGMSRIHTSREIRGVIVLCGDALIG